MELSVPRFEMPAALRRTLAVLMAAGALTFLAGLVVSPERTWPNFLIAFFYVTGLGLGAGFFIATQYVSNAGWSVAFRRVPEAITAILPVAGAGCLILIFGMHRLYEWTDPSAVARDAILRGKSAWLNQPFFLLRLAGYFVIWIVLSRVIVRNSLRQDEDGDVAHTERNVRSSVVFIVLGGYSACLASIDLLMSLQPRWYSTIFGLLSLSGSFTSALAVMTVLVILLRRAGGRQVFTSAHLYDLGRLLMSFSVFWVYLWVSQHLLIWYSNLPEEGAYYALRHSGAWGYVSVANVLLSWLIPFVVLLPRASKSSDKVLLGAAVVMLIGHWVDLYVTVMPARFPHAPPFGIWEILPFLGAMALFFRVVLGALGSRNLVPVRDPYLVESLP